MKQHPIEITVSSSEKSIIQFVDNSLEMIASLPEIAIDNCFVITDANLVKLYRNQLSTYFDPSRIISIPVGEKGKAFQVVSTVSNALAAAGVDRQSTLIAFGGGVVTDVTGFIASILLRGVSWIAVPTSLLAMIDAAIGGKTGIDTGSGKNQLGTFHHPAHVLIDAKWLETLPEIEMINGYGEALKYGLLFDAEWFREIVQSDFATAPTSSQIETCVKWKSVIVQRDPFDLNERKILNFGHTAGHALEAASSYRVKHGEAVVWGMKVAISLSSSSGKMTTDVANELLELLAKFPLSSCFIDPEQFFELLAFDKKRTRNDLKWILLTQAGQAERDCRILNDVAKPIILEHLTALEPVPEVVPEIENEWDEEEEIEEDHEDNLDSAGPESKPAGGAGTDAVRDDDDGEPAAGA